MGSSTSSFILNNSNSFLIIKNNNNKITSKHKFSEINIIHSDGEPDILFFNLTRFTFYDDLNNDIDKKIDNLKSYTRSNVNGYYCVMLNLSIDGMTLSNCGNQINYYNVDICKCKYPFSLIFSKNNDDIYFHGYKINHYCNINKLSSICEFDSFNINLINNDKKENNDDFNLVIDIEYHDYVNIYNQIILKKNISQIFNNTLDNHEINYSKYCKAALIKFYVPWCYYCQKLENDWLEISNMFNSDNNVKVLRVNCETNIQNFETIKFPAIVFLIDGKIFDFYKNKYSRNKTGILKWIEDTMLTL